MDASDMTGSVSSPRMMVRCMVNCVGAYKLPSRRTSHEPGASLSFASERASALRIAGTMPRESITAADANDTAKSSRRARCSCCICLYIASRAPAVSCFESFTPSTSEKSNAGERATAPTATGPASGPRPASSMPTRYCIQYIVPKEIAGLSRGRQSSKRSRSCERAKIEMAGRMTAELERRQVYDALIRLACRLAKRHGSVPLTLHPHHVQQHAARSRYPACALARGESGIPRLLELKRVADTIRQPLVERTVRRHMPETADNVKTVHGEPHRPGLFPIDLGRIERYRREVHHILVSRALGRVRGERGFGKRSELDILELQDCLDAPPQDFIDEDDNLLAHVVNLDGKDAGGRGHRAVGLRLRIAERAALVNEPVHRRVGAELPRNGRRVVEHKVLLGLRDDADAATDRRIAADFVEYVFGLFTLICYRSFARGHG